MDVLNIAVGLVTVISGLITIVFALKKGGAKTGDEPTATPAPTTPAPGTRNEAKTVKPSPVVAQKSSVKPTSGIAGVREFVDDDAGYRKWVEDNPQGFVVNAERGSLNSRGYLPLHKATCAFISNFNTQKIGAFTERDYVKVCSMRIEPLQKWAKTHGREDGTFTGNCRCLSK